MSCCERSSFDRWLLLGALVVVGAVVGYAALTNALDASHGGQPQGVSLEGVPPESPTHARGSK